MVQDYGLKTFHLIKESGEVYYEVQKGEKLDVKIELKGGFDIISFPILHYGKGVKVYIEGFNGSSFNVVIENISGRKKKGNLIYEFRGLHIWT